MEQFGVAAAHSGAINHIHAIHFGPAAVDVVREMRLVVTVVVVGWVAVTGIRTFFDHRRQLWQEGPSRRTTAGQDTD